MAKVHKHLRVRAVPEHCVPRIDREGNQLVGRFVARGQRHHIDCPQGEILDGGELVHPCAYYQRFIDDGSLYLMGTEDVES